MNGIALPADRQEEIRSATTVKSETTRGDRLDASIHHRQAHCIAFSEFGVGHTRLRPPQIHYLYSR
jgi:hypothetical protein